MLIVEPVSSKHLVTVPDTLASNVKSSRKEMLPVAPPGQQPSPAGSVARGRGLPLRDRERGPPARFPNDRCGRHETDVLLVRSRNMCDYAIGTRPPSAPGNHRQNTVARWRPSTGPNSHSHSHSRLLEFFHAVAILNSVNI